MVHEPDTITDFVIRDQHVRGDQTTELAPAPAGEDCTTSSLATKRELAALGTGFHILRHTFGSWMRQFGGLDIRGLVGTVTWADIGSASRYVHVVASKESRKADLLPTES
jgi:site-specific recombinase XerD